MQNISYEYQVGGSLSGDALTYVKRKADDDFYKGLKAGKFCYVLNARQMGKSSLQVRTMKRLKEEGLACAVIDISNIGSKDVTREQFYAGIIRVIVRDLGLQDCFDLRKWWQDFHDFSAVQRTSIFIEEVLLKEIKEQIVIFVDESDAIKDFGEDFFTLIRTCYNDRANKPDYNRLTFAILGVASPGDLIKDVKLTPFNIGRAVDLTGFDLHEATPLAIGLHGKAENPTAMLRAVLDWTGGQPFLTHKLCKLIYQGTEKMIPEGTEAERVLQIVKSRVIENWEARDEPLHLRYIQRRISDQGGEHAGRLLGLYQQVLASDPAGLAADGTPDELELRLSGLVVLREGRLRVYNRIYAAVFHQEWTEKALKNLRPYQEALKAWITSDCKDKSRLLRGESLKDALIWAERKSLSDDDYRFLAASQKSAQKAQARNWIIATVFVFGLFMAGLAFWGFQERNHAVTAEKQAVKTEKMRTESLFDSHLTHASLLARIEDYAAAKEVLKQSLELDNEIPLERRHARNLLSGFCRMRGGEADKVYEGAGAALFSVAVSPDGRLIAAAGERGTLVLFDAETGKLLKLLEGHDANAGQAGVVFAVVFHPEGKWLASAGDDGRIILWSGKDPQDFEHPEDIQKLREWKAPDAVKAIAVSPDLSGLDPQGFKNPEGLKFILASGGTDSNITLWNPETGKALQTLKGHTEMISEGGIAFSPSGEYLASASYDDTARVWELKTGKTLHVLKGHTNDVHNVAFSSDGKILATSSSDKSVRLWNAETGEPIRVLIGHQNMVFGLRFIPNTPYLISASFDRSLRVWDTETGATLGILQGHNAGVVGIALHKYDDKADPHGALSLLNEKISMFSAGNDGTVRRWDMAMRYQKMVDLPSEPFSTAISPDGKSVAVGFANGSLRLYSLPDGDLLWENEKAHQDVIARLAFNADGALLASAGFDKVAKLWKVEKMSGSLTEIQTFAGHTRAVYAVAFSPDSKTLATASHDGKIGLFTIGRDEKRFIENAHEGKVESVAFDSSGARLLSCGYEDRSIRLWDIAANPPALLREFPKAQNMLLWASLSPDDKRVAAVGRDNLVHTYNAQDGREAYRLVGHENTILRAIFSPDSQQVATVGGDATVRLWDLSNGKELFCLRLPAQPQAGTPPLWDFDFRVTPKGDCLIAVPLTRGKLVLYELNYENVR